MAGLIHLCMNQVSEASSVNVTSDSDNPILTDSIQSLAQHGVFKNTDDESLKTFLKFSNQLLNDPKSRAKGLMLLDNFLSQVDSSKFVIIQESFVSALHLLAKCLDLDLSHRILLYLLPITHKLPELSQAVVSSILPKLMTRFIENNKSSTTFPSNEEIRSVLTCMERFRGPCGSYRLQLEKVLLPFVDQDVPDFPLISKIFPLLSATSGGGNKGDKYSMDWSNSIMKLLAVTHSTLIELYSNTSSLIAAENPYEFEGNGMELPAMRPTKDVLLKISLLNRRLCNLVKILCAYLEEPFPAPKLVPLRGILNLIGNMVSVNPLGLMRNPAQEIQHLAGLIPTIQEAALELLDKLILSCGSQIFPEAARIEFQILQQFKWISSLPNSFHGLRRAAYCTLQNYLDVTKGSMTAPLNSSTLLEYIFQDIRIEKHTVSLSLGTKNGKKSGNKKGKHADHGITASSLALQGGDQNISGKNEALCSAALKTLKLLIPSLTLDATSYKMTYLLLATTIAQFLESSEHPGQYNSAECRLNAFDCLLQLALFPSHTSPVSLGLIVNLLELGCGDTNIQVAHCCEHMLAVVERFIHPPCGTLHFPPVEVKLPLLSRHSSLANTMAAEAVVADSDSEDAENESEVPAGAQENGDDLMNNDGDLEDSGSVESGDLNDTRTTNANELVAHSTATAQANKGNFIDIALLKDSVAPFIKESVEAAIKEQLGAFSFDLSKHLQKLKGQRREHGSDDDDDDDDQPIRKKSTFNETRSSNETCRVPPHLHTTIPNTSKATVTDVAVNGSPLLVTLPGGEDEEGRGDRDAVDLYDLPNVHESGSKTEGQAGDKNSRVVTVEDILLTFDDEIVFSDPKTYELKETKTFKVKEDKEKFEISEALLDPNPNSKDSEIEIIEEVDDDVQFIADVASNQQVEAPMDVSSEVVT